MELVTIASIPAIIALVTLAKDMGLPSKIAPALAVVLGIFAALLDAYIVGGLIDGPSVAKIAATGVILGLGAAGLYDGAKAVGARRAEPTYLPRHARDAEETPPPLA